jgi:hypothetical protein
LPTLTDDDWIEAYFMGQHTVRDGRLYWTLHACRLRTLASEASCIASDSGDEGRGGVSLR